MKVKVMIDGMSCGHCVMHVMEAISELNGVADVEVSLEKKCAEFNTDGEVTDADIKAAIEDLGYEVKDIKHI